MAAADQTQVPTMTLWKKNVTGKRPKKPARATTKRPHAPMVKRLPITARCTAACARCHSL